MLRQLTLINVLIACCLYTLCGQIPSRTLPFQYRLTGKGQDVNFVYQTIQDQQGFLWWATLDGLVRYDGNKSYPFSSSNGSGLQGKRVHGMAIDQHDQLWFIAGQRLQVLDLLQEEFHTIVLPDSNTLFHFSFSKFNPLMVAAPDGTIWVRSAKGVLRIQSARPLSQAVVKRYPGPDTNAIDVEVLYIDNKENLWVGTKTGLFRYLPDEDRLEACPLGVEATVNALCQTRGGEIVVGLADAGLCFYDPLTAKVKYLSQAANETAYLAGESVHQLAIDGKGSLWLFAGSYLTQTFSLQRWDAAQERFQTYLPNQEAIGGKAQLGEVGFQLFTDSKGFLWVVGSHGLYQFDPWKNYFFRIHEKDNHPKDWSGINPMYEDQTGVLWWGTSADGVFCYAPSSYKFDVFLPALNEERGLSFAAPLHIDRQDRLWLAAGGTTQCYRFDEKDQPVQLARYPFFSLSFLEDREGSIWMGTFGGVFRYEPATGMVSSEPLPVTIQVPYTVALEDQEGWLWLPTLGQGLFRYHWKKDTLVHYHHEPDNPFSIQSDALSSAMLEDRQGRIWVGGMDGLDCYDPHENAFTHFLSDVRSIVHLYEDQAGRIWATTAGNGMYRLTFSDFKTDHFSYREGFPTNRPFYMLEDAVGKLWISSDQGMLRFDPGTDEWQLFDSYDGVPHPGFAYGADRRVDGELFYSLMNGEVVRFKPAALQEDSFPPKVRFTDLKIANESVAIGVEGSPLAQAIWATDYLELNHRQRVFSLEFAAMHYAALGQNEYAWRMPDLQNEWQVIGKERRLNFAGLATGKYTLQVKAANHDGHWGKAQSLQLRVRPPWWLNSWAIVVYGLLTAGLLWALYRWRRKRWELHTQLLMEHEESVRLKELDQAKTKLYTNISHEFRTPLTIILGMADQIRKHPQEWYAEGLEMIKRNGRQLLRLVNQMLQLSKVEAGVLPVKRIQTDLIAYTRYLLESFRVLAEDRGLTLHFEPTEGACLLDIDPDKWRDILTNLVSNALKFTPSGGQVSVITELYNSEQESRFVLLVQDTGVGIPADQLPFVFDRFYSHGDQSSTTGIGLALTRELTLLLDGNISVQSELGKGSCFRVEIPAQRVASPVKVSELPASQPVLPMHKVEESSIHRGDPSKKQIRLLIVEDNPDVVQYLRSLLEENYQLTIASDGFAGLQQAKRKVPDLIISDVMMPKLNGFDLCTQLKADLVTSHIPIILLTAKADVAARVEGLRCGADAYLAKPFNEEELRVRLQMLFLAQKRQQERYRQVNFLASDDPQIQKEDAFMLRVQSILEAHLSDEHFGIQNLCQELGMSRAQLYRKFNGLTDQPIGHYFRSMRLNKAHQLLSQTDLHVGEVAYRVGFKDPAYFSRVFREEYGESPREWSQKNND